MVWPCNICSVFSSLSLKTLVRHITLQHALGPNLKVTCPVNGCQERYTLMDSFRKHLNRKHREELVGTESTTCTSDCFEKGEHGSSSGIGDNLSGESSDGEYNLNINPSIEVRIIKQCIPVTHICIQC